MPLPPPPSWYARGVPFPPSPRITWSPRPPGRHWHPLRLLRPYLLLFGWSPLLGLFHPRRPLMVQPPPLLFCERCLPGNSVCTAPSFDWMPLPTPTIAPLVMCPRPPPPLRHLVLRLPHLWFPVPLLPVLLASDLQHRHRAPLRSCPHRSSCVPQYQSTDSMSGLLVPLRPLPPSLMVLFRPVWLLLPPPPCWCSAYLMSQILL